MLMELVGCNTSFPYVMVFLSANVGFAGFSSKKGVPPEFTSVLHAHFDF
jgi:hypothetical protein